VDLDAVRTFVAVADNRCLTPSNCTALVNFWRSLGRRGR
jgi:hypothetical protein